MEIKLTEVFDALEEKDISVTLYGVRYRYNDQFNQEDFLYPVAFTTEDKAEAWLSKSISAPYLSVETISLNPKVTV